MIVYTMNNHEPSFSMVFEHVFRYAIQRIRNLPCPHDRTLYIGQTGMYFPPVTTYRFPFMRMFNGTLPYPDRSIAYVFGQLHDYLPAPWTLHYEFLRTCKQGLLTTRSPLSTVTYDAPESIHDVRYATWTDPTTNQLCFLPVTTAAFASLDPQELDKWMQVATVKPLRLFNIYEWEHAMEFNIKLYPLDLDPQTFRATFQEACELSMYHTQEWVDRKTKELESTADADGQSP